MSIQNNSIPMGLYNPYASKGFKKKKFTAKSGGRRWRREIIYRDVKVHLPAVYNKAGVMMRDHTHHMKRIVDRVIIHDNYRNMKPKKEEVSE